MSVNGIVETSITRQSGQVATTGFGKLAVFAYHERHTERVLEFNNAADMLQANGGPFLATDITYIMANSAFSQSPRPTSILSVRRMYPLTRTVSVVPKANLVAGQQFPLNNTDYTVTINGEVFTYTTDASATVAEIIAGFVTLIHAGSQNVVVVPGTGSFIIFSSQSPGNNSTPGPSYTIEVDSNLFDIEDITPVPTGVSMAEEIAATIDVDDSFYGIVGDWFSRALILDVAAAVEPMERLFVASTFDSDVTDNTMTTDVASELLAAGYNNTAFIHSNQPELAAAGYHGKILPTIPGSATQKFKTIAGLSVQNYTATEISTMRAKNANFYVRRKGRNITCDGKVAGGEFIDTVRLIHWTNARICEAVFGVKVSNPKVPFTNAGIALEENAVRGVLLQGVANGGIATDPAFTITVPDANPNNENGVNIADRANRILDGIEFCYTLAGAIHLTRVRGTVKD